MKTIVFAVAFICFASNAQGLPQKPAADASQKSAPPACAPAAYLTFEFGKLAGVDWVSQDANRVHTRTILNQSMVIDATIDMRADQTAAHSSVILTMAGDEPQKPKTRDLGDGAIYWSDMIVSSVQQAIARARIIAQPSAIIPAASLYSSSRGEVSVERFDPTDWVVSYHHKRYQVLTDGDGCMLSAILPEYGVTIERRTNFPADSYPTWLPYAAPPDGAYSAADVTIPAPQGHVLAATLTRPSQKKLAPAAVLITGLSPHERNNGQPPWMPFRDIADALTRAGIAVLRVDDRGVGKSTGDHAPSTTLDEADDVQAEVAWLRTQPGIDPKRIALVGYSEGGLIAPIAASKDPSIAAIVTLAGPGVPGPELAHYQIEQAVIGDPSIAVADREKEIAKQLAEPLTPRERVFLALDPLEFAARVRCPALIIQGATDLHVPPRSTEKIAAAMRANGNSDVTVRLFPAVSHSLLPDTIGLESGWVMLPGFLTTPPLLDALTQWAVQKLVTTSTGAPGSRS